MVGLLISDVAEEWLICGGAFAMLVIVVVIIVELLSGEP
jgi:hypothetical protein